MLRSRCKTPKLNRLEVRSHQWWSPMTPAQCRAARYLLRWNQDDLAREASVSVVTIRNFENEKSSPQRATADVMRRAFEAAGVAFIPKNGGGVGVRLRDGDGAQA
jgi:DNA-binding XRE family transcriptional regulator